MTNPPGAALEVRARFAGAPRKRADVLLVERGLFESRARARAAIEAGLVTADDKQVAGHHAAHRREHSLVVSSS